MIEETFIDSDEERAALSLFSRDGLSTEYKRVLLYVVYKTIAAEGRMVQMRRIVHQTSMHLSVTSTDVKSAITALNVSFAFDALTIFIPRDDPKAIPVVRIRKNPVIEKWLQEVETKYPHVLLMVPKPRTKQHIKENVVESENVSDSEQDSSI